MFFLIVFALFKLSEQNVNKNPIPIIIKDDGIQELTKGDVAMIFYITVTNTGNDPVHLSVDSSGCCQHITKTDEDCESMRLYGGDMGKLYPRDTRNLTLLFANLYLHERLGTCTIVIKDSVGPTMVHAVHFNTMLIRDKSIHMPRVLQKYYQLADVSSCKSVDHDPLNQCQPYPCLMRYDGARSYYNHTSTRCEKLPRCISKNKDEALAYILETNSCKVLRNAMTKADYAEFKEGKPGVQTLTHAHGYPLNVQCHNGRRDERGRWCRCNPGWDSAPFDHKNFNMDLQVYHMCTIWLGKMSDPQARNITVIPRSRHYVTNIILFTVLIALIISLILLLLLFLLRKKLFQKESEFGGELVSSTDSSETSEDE